MNNFFKFSKSENNGLRTMNETDLNILSVGISTGGAAEIKMIENNDKRKVIATTIDKDGIKFTQKVLQEKKLADKIKIQYKDVTKKMPYKDEYFDFIYARLVLHYLNDNELRKALKELYRVLKSKGRIFIVVRSTNDIGNLLEDSTYCDKTGMTRHADYRTIGTDAVKYIYRRFHSKETIKKFLEEANFEVKYTKEYKEQLYTDYERKEKALKIATLLETLGIKK